jgi:hypothetical protein
MMLKRALEIRAWGRLDNELAVGQSGGDGVIVRDSYYLVSSISKLFIFFLATCGLSLLREGVGGKGL